MAYAPRPSSCHGAAADSGAASRAQPLDDFTGSKHACDAAQASHNSTRRLKRAAAAAAAGDAEDATTSRHAVLPACDDVTAWLEQCAANATTAAAAAAAARAAQSAGASLLRLDVDAAATASALHGFSLLLKLPECASPTHLPPPALLRASLGLALPDAAAPPTAAVEPGCVLLRVDALRRGPPAAPARAPQDVNAVEAARVAAALQRCGFAAAPCAQHAHAVVRNACCALQPNGNAVVIAPTRLQLMLAAQALLLAPAGEEQADVTLPFSVLAGDAADAATLSARCGGHGVAVEATAAALRLSGSSLRAVGSGALLLEATNATHTSVSAGRVILLCRDAALAAQVNATLAGCGGADALDAAMQNALRVLGDALRPGAAAAVRAAAAAQAVWLGWDAAITALLRLAQQADDADDAVMLVALHVLAHACAARRAGRAAAADACLGALASTGGALLSEASAGAWSVAAQLLEDATDAGGHLLPACAAGAALERALAGDAQQRQAARVLRGVMRLLASSACDAAEPGDSSDTQAADDYEYAYITFLTQQNQAVWRVMAPLSLAGNLTVYVNSVRYVLLRSEWPSLSELGSNGLLISGSRLWPAHGGAPFSPLDVPWPVVVSHTRLYLVFQTLLLLPAHLGLVYQVLRMWRGRAPPRNFVPVMSALIAVDSLSYLVTDLLILRATGAAIEWPALGPALLHTAGVALLHLRGPTTPPFVRSYMLLRLLNLCAVLLYVGRARILLVNVGYASQIVATLATIALAGRRDAAMRAVHRATLAAARDAAQQSAKKVA